MYDSFDLDHLLKHAGHVFPAKRNHPLDLLNQKTDLIMNLIKNIF
jgi:hypothetical protein